MSASVRHSTLMYPLMAFCHPIASWSCNADSIHSCIFLGNSDISGSYSSPLLQASTPSLRRLKTGWCSSGDILCRNSCSAFSRSGFWVQRRTCWTVSPCSRQHGHRFKLLSGTGDTHALFSPVCQTSNMNFVWATCARGGNFRQKIPKSSKSMRSHVLSVH